MPGGAKGPGLIIIIFLNLNVLRKLCLGIFFIIPCVDTYKKVDLRVLSFDVPPQEVSFLYLKI